MKKLFFIPAVATVMFLASCGGGDTTATETDMPAATETEAPAAADAPGSDIPGIGDVMVTDNIELEGMDNMKYDKNLFKIKAGQEVKLTFKNVGKLPKEAMANQQKKR